MEQLILDTKNRVLLATRKLHTINLLCFYLSREGLSWNCHEKRLLLYQTSCDEKIYMRYPGKESDRNFLTKGNNKSLNPFDFKPDLVMANGKEIAPLTNHNLGIAIKNIINTSCLQRDILIAFFLNMAFYKLNAPDFSFVSSQDVYFTDGKISSIKESEPILLYYCQLQIPDEICQSIKDMKVPIDSGSISIEALFYYIDVLAMQEDCKYQRDIAINYIKYNQGELRYDSSNYVREAFNHSKKYGNHVGRINFISSLANFASSVGTSNEYTLLQSLRRNKNVFPLALEDYSKLTLGKVIYSTPQE